MQLIRLHPKVAFRDCKECEKWVHNEETGDVEEKGGIKVERYAGVKTPCRYSQGCPKGTPEQSKELTDQNYQAYHFVLECKAVNCFPDDPIVRRNAMIIDHVEQLIQEFRQQEATEYIKALTRMTALKW